MLAVALQRVRQRELLEHHRREAVQQQHHRVVGPGDVRVREGHRAHVVRRETQRVREARPARDQRTVRVQHALGVGGGAGGPVDPADGGAFGGRGGQDGRVAVRELIAVVRLEDPLRAEPSGHRRVVEAAPGAGDREVLRLRLPQREADFAVPVEGDHRRLYGAQAGQCEGEQGGLDAGGQLPGDDRAGAYTHAVQAGRNPLGAALQLAEAQGAVVLEEDRVVGGEVGAAGDQFPEGAGGAQCVGGVVHGGGPLWSRTN